MKFLSTIVALFLLNNVFAYEFLGEVILDNRYFLNEGTSYQDKMHSSFSYSSEIFHEEEDYIFHLKPKIRKDSQDPKRNLLDLQEFYLLHIGEEREIKFGISKEFWGVTETTHRVDIINQTDFTEGFDGEEKLGQPMMKVSLEKEWGVLDIYALFSIRERQFSGQEGRLRLPLIIDKNESIYESSAKNKRTDFAARWSNYYDQLDIAISYFSGTTREPRLVPTGSIDKPLIPYYETIDQFGLELLYLIGSLAIKVEAISRTGQGDRFSAATYGFEYTQVGIFDSRIDLGWIFEGNHDDRLKSSPTVLGTRLSFNDELDSQILSGFIWNDVSKELGFLLESSRRVGECCLIALEGVYFEDTDEDNNEPKLFDAFREDDFFKIEFTYYL